VIYPQDGDNPPKGELIPNVVACRMTEQLKMGILRNLSLVDEPASYQLVGEVMAYQGYDG
jgi:hypothetical protein